MNTWTLFYGERPWTTNAERSWHYHKRAKAVRETREAFMLLAHQMKVPKLAAIKVAATPLAKDRRGIQDVAACYPAVKAAIDGLVDAGVVIDDDPRYVTSLTFLPTKVTGVDGLEIEIGESDEATV